MKNSACLPVLAPALLIAAAACAFAGPMKAARMLGLPELPESSLPRVELPGASLSAEAAPGAPPLLAAPSFEPRSAASPDVLQAERLQAPREAGPLARRVDSRMREIVRRLGVPMEDAGVEALTGAYDAAARNAHREAVRLHWGFGDRGKRESAKTEQSAARAAAFEALRTSPRPGVVKRLARELSRRGMGRDVLQALEDRSANAEDPVEKRDAAKIARVLKRRAASARVAAGLREYLPAFVTFAALAGVAVGLPGSLPGLVIFAAWTWLLVS